MTIEEIERLIDEALFAEGENAVACCNGGTTIYLEKACSESYSKLKEAIIEYGRECEEKSYHKGWREGAKNGFESGW